MEALPRMIGCVCLGFLGLVLAPGCYSGQTNAATNGVTLAAVEALHERLNSQLMDTGGIALYQGALAYPPGRGLTPVFYPGRWDVYPYEKVLGDSLSPTDLMKKSDAFLSLRITQVPSSESVVLTVKGERLVVSINGVTRSWSFPRSPHKTVQAWLESCSDGSFGERLRNEQAGTNRGSRGFDPAPPTT